MYVVCNISATSSITRDIGRGDWTHAGQSRFFPVFINQIKYKNKRKFFYLKRTGGWDKGNIRRGAAKQFPLIAFVVQNHPRHMSKFTPIKPID